MIRPQQFIDLSDFRNDGPRLRADPSTIGAGVQVSGFLVVSRIDTGEDGVRWQSI
jgi:hypothetical protein